MACKIIKKVFHFRGIMGLAIIPFLFIVRLHAEPSIESSVNPSTDGFYLLQWTSDENSPSQTDSQSRVEFLLEELSSDDSSDTHVLYRGMDQSTTISGKHNGIYRYRISSRTVSDNPDEPWVRGNTLDVRVQHHSLTEAITFLITGGIVFLITALFILIGYIKTKG